MTEITVENSRHIPAWASARPGGAPVLRKPPELPEPPEGARYIIDPVAFFVALIGAPLLFTLATFWVLFIPVGALYVGSLPYLVIGTPVLLYHLSRNPARPGDLASLSIAVCLVLGLAFIALAAVFGHSESATVAFYITLCAIIFAPCWAATFGWLYTKLARDFYTQPI